MAIERAIGCFERLQLPLASPIPIPSLIPFAARVPRGWGTAFLAKGKARPRVGLEGAVKWLLGAPGAIWDLLLSLLRKRREARAGRDAGVCRDCTIAWNHPRLWSGGSVSGLQGLA